MPISKGDWSTRPAEVKKRFRMRCWSPKTNVLCVCRMFGRLGALSYVMECKANSSALRRRERCSNASTIEFGFSEAPSHSTNRGAVPSRPVVVSRDIYRRADVFRTPFIPCSKGSPIIAKCRIFEFAGVRYGTP